MISYSATLNLNVWTGEAGTGPGVHRTGSRTFCFLLLSPLATALDCTKAGVFAANLSPPVL